MELDDFTSALAQADFFRICDDEQRRLLAFASERRSFASGDVIYKRGDRADGAFVLLSGEVSAGDSEGSAGFKPQRISERGAVLGEMALFLDKPRRTSLRAATDVDLLFVPRSAIAKLMRQFPGLAERAARRIEDEMSSYLGAMERFRDGR
ncbi:MAG: cyclic nucleotide-binding domain-containing protein [Alphaproteobacteria bacterium]|nr:cyclic nucleotide-binding domain-containing protein [Alphaproteobacteria bacterium]